MDYAERNLASWDWITLLLLGCFVLFALVKFLYPKRFDEFVQLPITNKYFLVHGKNDDIRHPFNLLLFATQIVSASLFIYLLFWVFVPSTVASNALFFLQICTIYTVFVGSKFFIEKILGTVFSIEPLMGTYLYQKLSYRNLLSFLLFIANLFFFYFMIPGKETLGVFVALVILFNAIALFYSYRQQSNLIFKNLPYFILYLCAFEISPYIILFKTFF